MKFFLNKKFKYITLNLKQIEKLLEMYWALSLLLQQTLTVAIKIRGIETSRNKLFSAVTTVYFGYLFYTIIFKCQLYFLFALLKKTNKSKTKKNKKQINLKTNKSKKSYVQKSFN